VSQCDAATFVRDVLYVVNFGSKAGDEVVAMLNYVKGAYCRYDDTASRVGLILYGLYANVTIPLASYTHAEWQVAVEAVSQSADANLLYGLAPLTEALALALVEFARVTGSLRLPLVEIVSASLPQPLAITVESANDPTPWSYPYPTAYLGAWTCQGTSPGTCNAPVPYYQYLGTNLTANVAALNALGTFIDVLLVPSTTTDACVSAMIYNGVPGFADPSCTTDADYPAMSFNWCAMYTSSLGMPTDPLVCKCAKCVSSRAAF